MSFKMAIISPRTREREREREREIHDWLAYCFLAFIGVSLFAFA